jgi:uncharacterized protein YfbU (UPF0304 family)
MADRIIKCTVSGFQFKQSELSRMLTELANFEVRFDENARMACYNYIDNRWERLLEKDALRFLYERRSRLKIAEYRESKLKAALNMCLFLVKKTGFLNGWLRQDSDVEDDLPVMVMEDV